MLSGFRSRLPTLILWMCLYLVVLTGLGLTALIWSERQTALNSAGRETLDLLAPAAEMAEQWMKAADRELAADAQQLLNRQPSGPDLGPATGLQAFRETLIQQAARLPAVEAISVFDATGQLAVVSFNRIPDHVSLSDTPFWHRLQTEHGARSIVSDPVAVPGTRDPRLLVGRPIWDASGHLLGAMVAVISLPELKALFQALAGKGRRVVVSRPDGAIVFATSPGSEDASACVRDAWAQLVAQGGGFTTISCPSGPKLLVAAHGSSQTVFVAAVSRPTSGILQEQERTEATIIALAAVALLSILLLFYCLANALRNVQGQAERLRFMAAHDSLTGLTNRAAFVEVLEGAMANNGVVAVHLLDLDRFKLINDTRGHPTGDALLVIVGKRLRHAVRSEDIVARLGGDEFVVMQRRVKAITEVEALAGRLVEALAAPFVIDGETLIISVSVGMAIAPEDGASWRQLMRNADVALYRAKESGRNTYHRFFPDLDERQQDRFALEQDLRMAISLEQLHVAYQPIINLRDGHVCGFEALIRWVHPTRGLISPASFIPIAEATGSILALGHWVGSVAIDAAATWPDDIFVAINVSALELQARDFPTRIRHFLSETGLAANRLVLEITETTILHGENDVRSVMETLRASGIQFALDDFGTGHAGLSYLHKYPFSRIKLDQSFVRDLGKSAAADAIIETTLALSKRLNLAVVAEGVETTEQLKRLAAIGCHLVQGYLFSTPVRGDEVPHLIDHFRRNGAAHRRQAYAGSLKGD